MTTSDLPVAPPRPPRQRRHSTTVMALARRMYGDGDSWTPTQIYRYMLEHLDGPVPSVNTIRRWVIPAEADAQRAWTAASERRRRAAARATTPVQPDEELTERALLTRMVLLRRTGLSYSAIAKVVALYHDQALTEHQVRLRLLKAGAPTSAAKSAATRRLWAETTTYREAA